MAKNISKNLANLQTHLSVRSVRDGLGSTESMGRMPAGYTQASAT